MKKSFAYITTVLVMSLGLSVASYADIISDAPVEIGAAPVGEAVSESVPETEAADVSGLQNIDMSVLSSLAPAELSPTDQPVVSEASEPVQETAAEEPVPGTTESALQTETSYTSVSGGTYSAPVEYVTVGGMVAGSMTGPAMISSGSAAAVSSGSGQAGSAYANDAKVSVDLGYVLVSPQVDYSGFKVAEGSAQLADGSWETIEKKNCVRNRYYKLISEQTDAGGNGWYVVAAGGRQVGNYRTSDGSILSEIWLKKSDCTAQSYIELNTTNATRQQIVRNALALLGKRYQYAGNGPDAFDCSGFVNYIMNSVGISVPRSSSEICSLSSQVSIDRLRPGDIVGRPGHVGIYIGDGWFVHASESNTGVVTESMEVYNRSNRFTNYINVVGD